MHIEPDSVIIFGTTKAKIYRTHRWDSPIAPELAYQLPVPSGTYTVRLHFADVFSGTNIAGRRIFSVAVEGITVRSNLDIVATAGWRTALIIETEATVSDGSLTISFVHQVENPLISAIEVLVKPPTNVVGKPLIVSSAPTNQAIRQGLDL